MVPLLSRWRYIRAPNQTTSTAVGLLPVGRLLIASTFQDAFFGSTLYRLPLLLPLFYL